MKRSLTLFLALLLVSLLALTTCGAPLQGTAATAPRQGNTYYVAPGGDDGNPGTIDLPWQTVQHAADTLVAGDTVYIRAGTYPEQVIPLNSGSAGQVITYAAYPGEVATIDGAAVTAPPYTGLFFIGDRQYLRVSGLRVINSNEAGILADGCAHVTIDNNSTYNTASSGIGVWSCTDVTVSFNYVDESCGGGMQECITIAGTDTSLVHSNEVLNCHKEGICIKDGSANAYVYRNNVHHIDRVGIYIDAWDKYTHDITVFENTVHDVLDSSGFIISSEQGGLLENVWVYNNVSYANRYMGLSMHECCPGPATHPVQNVNVVNNTFYGNGVDWGGGIAVDNPDIQNVTLRNNIVSQNLSFQIVVGLGVPTATLSIDHNLIDGFRGYEGEVYGDAYVEGDPLFVNPAGADFHLQVDSPAIDQGSDANAPTTDYDGQPRPSGAGYDIGADEYVAAASSYRAYLPLTMVNSVSSQPAAVDDFVYQLQNIDLVAIGATAFDLAVVDYSADGSDAGAWTPAQIAALQHSPGGDKTVLSYMSIGEAENYRFYWDPAWDADNDGQPDPGAPAWLDIQNPDWAGNYKVHYWDPGWQQIVFQYTDRLLAAGFDGAYLDIIDAYEYYADQGRTTAAQEMVDLVAAIRAHAQAVDPDFLIFPQNGAALATLLPSYLDSVDGVGQEDIYYGYEGDDLSTPPTVTAELESYLDVFRAAGKLVLTVDYATTPANVDDAYAKSQAKGYVPYCTVRDLDRLVINPGHEPD